MKVYPIFEKENRSKIEMLLKATNKRNYVLWLIGTQTGYRVSDIVGLKVKDVKGKGKAGDIIDIPSGHANYLIKNSKDRTQALRRLIFYMNRAGENLTNRRVLNKAKKILMNK